MSKQERDYIPAATWDWLLPLYDPCEHLIRGGREKARLLSEAQIPPDARVLDIGCGTGTLMVMAKRANPDAEIVGVDPDPKALAIARKKAARRGLAIQFHQGYSQKIPFPDGSFDRVFSSMMLHHLKADVKRATFAEVRRLLRPTGRFHAMDFGPIRGGFAKLFERYLRRHAEIADNLDGRLPEMMSQAGLGEVEETGSTSKLVGSFSFYRASAAG